VAEPPRATGEDGAPTNPGALPFGERAWPTERYLALHRDSVRDITAFWEPLARSLLSWRKPFARVLDWDPPFARWFPEGELNVAENCLDRHRGTPVSHQVAYYWEGEDGARRTVSYADLDRAVNRLAAALAARGFSQTDFAAIYLPMVPELPVVMLALARLGIPFTAVFSGFSAEALADRIRRIGARLLFTADGGLRRGATVPLKAIADEALRSAPSVTTCVVVARTGADVPMARGRDVRWDDVMREGPGKIDPVALPSSHPLYLLYSSGTTGQPKAIVHGTAGYLLHVLATTRWVFDPKPGEVFWCAADVGWVTGHSYVIFGPLASGMTSVLYEGVFDHPTPDRFWELLEHYRVNVLYTSPTALRGLRRHGDGPILAHDRGSLRLLGTVGEAINPSVWRWYFEVVGERRCPIVDTWWQTETGGVMVSNAPGLSLVPMKPGSATYPLPGIDADVVDEHGAPAAPGAKGYVVVRQPWPGMLLTVWGDDARYRASYWSKFPGLYYAGDYAVRDADGYFWFLGRADEVLKVAGHRIGTIEIEDALVSFAGVAEAAVCGREDAIKGEVPVGFVVLTTGTAAAPDLPQRLAQHVGSHIGKFAQPADVYLVRRLPKTRSGKIMRRVLKAVADGRSDVGDVTTLEDDATVEEIRAALRQLGEEIHRGA
jgi:acetyl-CoA synthetase